MISEELMASFIKRAEEIVGNERTIFGIRRSMRKTVAKRLLASALAEGYEIAWKEHILSRFAPGTQIEID